MTISSDMRSHWRSFWNDHARSDTRYGRDSWSYPEFCLLITDVVNALSLQKDDIILDAGGGTGEISIALSPFAKQITLFDFGNDVVAKAREQTRFFKNIEVLKDDICVFENIEYGYTKVIVGSVLQYLNDYDDVHKVLANIFKVIVGGGRAFFTHNPDMSRKAAHIESYKNLAWDKERVKKALTIEELRLWIDKERFREISHHVGFLKSFETPINENLWQSTHMFDWLVEK